MSTAFFAEALNTVAHYWRVYRRDGVALGFITHDRDLAFDGLLHRAAPGLVPSAIRLSGELNDDEAAIEGVLSHGAIREDELAAGRFDGAEVEVGLVDWETLRSHALYHGSIRAVTREGAHFSADLASAKVRLGRDPIPRTSPSCRAEFCGPGCDLNPRRFEHRTRLAAIDRQRGTVTLAALPAASLMFGTLRFLEGPQAGDTLRIVSVEGDVVGLESALAPGVVSGAKVLLREGCDRTLATCATRFGNAANFRGEPFLPGTDLLAQYPVAR